MDYAEQLVLSLQRENNLLRAKLAEGGGDCVYCGIPAAEIAKCASGFPGCARMDDLMAVPSPAQDRAGVLEEALTTIQQVACGEMQVAVGETAALKWIDGYARKVLGIPLS